MPCKKPSVVTVKAPATCANLGPGFDCLGMALDIHNSVQLAVADDTSVEISGAGAGSLPDDESNLVLQSARRVASAAGRDVTGWALRQHNDIPLARGLGSSSAAIVAGLVAANQLLAADIGQGDLLQMAVDIEGHPDNVAPAMLGGLTVSCKDQDGLRVACFQPPQNLALCLVVPNYEVSTKQARRVLPDNVSHADAVFNLTHSTSVLAALLSSDMRLLRQAMKDRLHQPYRAKLVPQMSDCIRAALQAGAHAACLSGSGPTIAAFVTEGAEAVLEAMLQAMRDAGIQAEGRLARPQTRGATVTAP